MKYSLASDSFNSEEIQAGIEVLKSGKYTMGEKVEEFEEKFAQYVGAKHSIMVNSGSSANLLLVEGLIRRSQPNKAPLSIGDEVIVPALSWPTTVWPVAQLGLKPVYVDVDPKTLAIDLKKAKNSLTSKTKGMFLIHVLGQACNMQEYVSFCNKNGITLIEDCCETLGAYSDGKHVGTFSYGGSFSHFFSHHLTTMEGGSIVTNDSDFANDLRSFRAHGWTRNRSDKDTLNKKFDQFDSRFLFVTTGYNVRPMEIQAAIGLVQLKKINTFLEKRRKIAKSVYDITQKYCPEIQIIGSEMLEESKQATHSWMNIPFRIKNDIPLKTVMQILEDNNVETRSIIAGNLANHPANNLIDHRIAGDLNVSNNIFEKGFMIGCNPETGSDELGIIEKAFSKLHDYINLK